MKKNSLKLILALFITIIGSGCKLFFSQPVVVKADDSFFNIKLHEPRSPDRLKASQLVFVTLDIQQRAITVDCYAKKPGDLNFAKFDTASILKGGDSGVCDLTDLISESGTYSFYVTASVNNQIRESNRVSLDYTDEKPLKPKNYQKLKLADCKYQIEYTTAADEGKTSQVALYYSTATEFQINQDTEVARQAISSDERGSFTYHIDNCDNNVDHFFAIRAFDQAGNSSSAVGDEKIIENIIYIKDDNNDEEKESQANDNNEKNDSQRNSESTATTEAAKTKNLALADPGTPKDTIGIETEAEFTERKNSEKGLVKGQEKILKTQFNPIQEIASSAWLITLIFIVFITMLIAIFYISKKIFYD